VIVGAMSAKAVSGIMTMQKITAQLSGCFIKAILIGTQSGILAALLLRLAALDDPDAE
jgi:hypothetical protein